MFGRVLNIPLIFIYLRLITTKLESLAKIRFLRNIKKIILFESKPTTFSSPNHWFALLGVKGLISGERLFDLSGFSDFPIKTLLETI